VHLAHVLHHAFKRAAAGAHPLDGSDLALE
jgi:hypothetical protein